MKSLRDIRNSLGKIHIRKEAEDLVAAIGRITELEITECEHLIDDLFSSDLPYHQKDKDIENAEKAQDILHQTIVKLNVLRRTINIELGESVGQVREARESINSIIKGGASNEQ